MIIKIKHSVVIVTYNQEHLVLKTLQSVLNQTVLPQQIVILDDCSVDSTALVIKEYIKNIKHDLEIVLIVNEVNLGLQKNVLKGCNAASGNILTVMGGDDLLIPHTMERVESGIRKANLDPEVDNFVSYSPIIDRILPNNDKLIGYKILGGSPLKTAIRKTAPFVKIGFSKSAFKDVLYPSNLGIWADWLWDVSICAGDVKFYEIPTPCHIHISGIGVSSSTPEDLINSSYEAVAVEILKIFKQKISFSDKFYLLGEIYYQRGRRLGQLRDRALGFIFFLFNIFNYGGIIGLKSAVVRYFPGLYAKYKYKKL